MRPLASGTARVGWIKSLPQVLGELGCDAERLMAAADVPLALFDDPNGAVSFRSLGTILERSANLTGCPHVALLVAERFELAALGETAQLMAGADSVGEALRLLVLRFHLLDEGAVPMFLPAGRERAMLAHSIYARDVPALDQFADLATGIAVRVLKGLCGSAFQPLRVSLPHRPPVDLAPYHRALAPNVTFNAGVAAVAFDTSWLDQPVLGDEALRLPPRPAVAALQGFAPEVAPLAHLVRRALRPMVFTGTASEATAARLFSLTPRTLRRQLHAEGTSFLELLNATRFDIATQLLRDTDMRIADVAAALGYSEDTAFTRAFRAQAGVAPATWRRRECVLAASAGQPDRQPRAARAGDPAPAISRSGTRRPARGRSG